MRACQTQAHWCELHPRRDGLHSGNEEQAGESSAGKTPGHLHRVSPALQDAFTVKDTEGSCAET